MADLIDRQALREAMYNEAFETDSDEQMWDSGCWIRYKMFERILDSMPPAQPDIIRCKDCKHNPNETWFECPLAMFNENQRPETAWCWKGERRDDV